MDSISMRTCERHVETAEILIRVSKLSDHILLVARVAPGGQITGVVLGRKKNKRFSKPHDLKEVSARDAAAAAAAGSCLHQPGPGLQNVAAVAPCVALLISVWA